MSNLIDIINKLDTEAKLQTSPADWRPILAQECQAYVCGESFLAKRFDQINYRFCGETEVARLVRDNLYALLRFKYFPTASEQSDEKIQQIISSFTINLTTTLKKVTFDKNADGELIKLIPDYCIAFKNGVYNFRDNKWLFKYEIVEMPRLANNLYLYNREYAITWYLNFNFEPLDINIMTTDLKDVVSVFKELTSTQRNYCFELMYNMSHDMIDIFNIDRFRHLCEIVGYTLLTSFSQKFVFLIGAGGNGKNSLFDGCLAYRLQPLAANRSLDDIASKQFENAFFENRHINMYFESSSKDEVTVGFKESKNIKNITGSPNQSIEHKGKDAYPGYINCKHIFSANDQDKVKFNDNTPGFRRRINFFETWFTWDDKKRFLTKGDYYDTTFSEDLHEITDDITNTIAYVYLGMLGLKSGTDGFTRQFRFTSNDWKLTYTDIDITLKEKLEKLTSSDIVAYIRRSTACYNDCKVLFYDTNKTLLTNSKSMADLGFNTYDKLIEMLSDEEKLTSYFTDNDVFISVRLLQQIVGDLSTPTSFTQALKKLYSVSSMQMLNANKPYIKCTFEGRRLKILR